MGLLGPSQRCEPAAVLAGQACGKLCRRVEAREGGAGADDLQLIGSELEPEAQPEPAPAADGTATGDEAAVAPAPAAQPNRATIAVYSRSRFGYGDMGVNEARVRAWLQALSSFEE